jgi:hypothetical protein
MPSSLRKPTFGTLCCKLLPLGLTALLIGGAHAATSPQVSNSFIYLPIATTTGIRAQGQIAIVKQTFADQTSKKYFLTDISVPIPSPSFGIQTVMDAYQANLVASFTRAGSVSSYAECSLEPRAVQVRSISFSVGLKSTGDGTLIRWGVCKDSSILGYNSIFPDIQAGALVVIKAKNIQLSNPYTLPLASVATPANAARQNAILLLLNNKGFKVAQ